MANHGSNISVTERQIYILNLLSEYSRGYTIEEIVEKLDRWGIEISKKTIQRDIDELSGSFWITEEELDKKTYYKASVFQLDKVDLTSQDMLGLAFMHSLLNHYTGVQMGKSAVNVLDKILDKAGKLRELEYMDSLQNIEIFDEIQEQKENIPLSMQQELSQAVAQCRKVRINYCGFQDDHPQWRVVHPYHFIFIRKSLCVEAFCEMRQDLRTFRLSRIVDIEILNDTFEKQDIKRENAFMYLNADYSETMKLHFSKDIEKYIMEYEQARADKITKVPDGIIFEKNTPINREVIRWILQFGGSVEVLEPKALREQICDEIEKLKCVYK